MSYYGKLTTEPRKMSGPSTFRYPLCDISGSPNAPLRCADSTGTVRGVVLMDDLDDAEQRWVWRGGTKDLRMTALRMSDGSDVRYLLPSIWKTRVLRWVSAKLKFVISGWVGDFAGLNGDWIAWGPLMITGNQYWDSKRLLVGDTYDLHVYAGGAAQWWGSMKCNWYGVRAPYINMGKASDDPDGVWTIGAARDINDVNATAPEIAAASVTCYGGDSTYWV